MTTSVRVWLSLSGRMLLHPDFRQVRARWRCEEVALDGGAGVDGMWWPLLHTGGQTLASSVPEDAISAVTEHPAAGDAVAEGKVRFGQCEMRTKAVQAQPRVLADESRVHALLQSAGNEPRLELVAQYDRNPVVRSIVRELVRGAAESSRLLTGAYIVASEAGDASLWELVAERARRGSAEAEGALRRWPDVRGIQYFADAFVKPADSVRAGGHLANAVMFFILCGADQGLGYLTSVLGDPFLLAAHNDTIRQARVQVGAILSLAEQLYGVQPRREWLEYVAAVMLAERIAADDRAVALPSKALELLGRYGDPRAPIIMWRLMRAGLYEEPDVLPALTAVHTREALSVVRSALEDCRAGLAKRSPRNREKLRRLEELVLTAEARLLAAVSV